MRTKIKIVTPVHVGNGENKLYFEYHFHDVYYNYSPQDIFMQIPPQDLLDIHFLDELTALKNRKSNKRLLNQKIRNYVDYKNLKFNYILNSDLRLSDNKDVAEQIKTMNKPYIPGSSLKGNIFNAIHYVLLKEKFSKIKSVSIKELPYKLKCIEDLLSVLYEDDSSFDQRQFNSFLKSYHQCLICRDILFDQLRLMDAKRQKVKEPFESRAPLSYVETIDFHQEVIDDYILIDDQRVESLVEKYSQLSYFNDFIQWLTPSGIKKACQTYFHDMLEEELEMNKNQGFYDYLGLTRMLNQLYLDQSSIYLRIGSHTNYFYKGVSYLFKKFYPSFFEGYFRLFTPISIVPGKPHPVYDTIPATRTYYFDDHSICYPGVIKLEFLDEN